MPGGAEAEAIAVLNDCPKPDAKSGASAAVNRPGPTYHIGVYGTCPLARGVQRLVQTEQTIVVQRQALLHREDISPKVVVPLLGAFQ